MEWGQCCCLFCVFLICLLLFWVTGCRQTTAENTVRQTRIRLSSSVWHSICCCTSRNTRHNHTILNCQPWRWLKPVVWGEKSNHALFGIPKWRHEKVTPNPRFPNATKTGLTLDQPEEHRREQLQCNRLHALVASIVHWEHWKAFIAINATTVITNTSLSLLLLSLRSSTWLTLLLRKSAGLALPHPHTQTTTPILASPCFVLLQRCHSPNTHLPFDQIAAMNNDNHNNKINNNNNINNNNINNFRIQVTIACPCWRMHLMLATAANTVVVTTPCWFVLCFLFAGFDGILCWRQNNGSVLVN